MRVLLTRPAEDSRRLARRLRTAGHEVLIAPMLEILPCGTGPIDTGDATALVLTSVNAVRHGVPRLGSRDLPVYCVGPKTAAAARAAGFAKVHAGSGNAGDLAADIAAGRAPAAGPLLHLAGAPHRPELAQGLRSAGFEVRVTTVYAARAIDSLPANIARALAEGDIELVLLYSPRSARRFAELVAPERRARLHLGALSAAVAAAAGDGYARVTVADRPNGEALLEATGLATGIETT